MHTLDLQALKQVNNLELWELNISLAVRSFAAGLVDVFLPIYLYKTGVNLSEIFLFYALVSMLCIGFSPLVAYLVTKIGPKHTLMANIPFQVGFYLLVSTLAVYKWPLWVLAFTLSLSYCLFRQGLNVQFVQHTSKTKQGQELGMIRVMQISAKAISPLFGGLVAYYFNYNFVLYLAIIGLILSSLPLYLTKDSNLELNFKFSRIFKQRKLKEFISLFAAGLEYEINLVIWPLILVVFLKNDYSSTGFITTVGIFVSVLSAYLIGKFSDVKREAILLIGVVGSFIGWIGRSFVNISWQILIVDSFFNISDTMKSIPYDSKVYDKFREENLMNYLVFHQTTVNLGRLVLFVFLFYFPDFIFGIYLGAGSSWFRLLF